MNNQKHTILAIHVHHRRTQAARVQKLFTEYGANIKTRLGLHDVDEQQNSPGGVIILEMHGATAAINAFAKKLSSVSGVEVKKIVFSHD